MFRYLEVHPINPQDRLIEQAVGVLREGGVLVFPTDSGYALGCHLGDKLAVERIRAIRQLDDKHNMTLLCRDLSEISVYAHVSNSSYRILRHYTPGPYTFLLDATREVPRRLQHPKRKTIGIRVPDNAIVRALLERFGEPLMSTTLRMPDDELPQTDPQEMKELLSHAVDGIIDGGTGAIEPTTVIDLSGEVPVIVRKGAGDTHPFE